jgi:hypothetical protein
MKDIGYIKREITFFSGHGRQISANSILKKSNFHVGFVSILLQNKYIWKL